MCGMHECGKNLFIVVSWISKMAESTSSKVLACLFCPLCSNFQAETIHHLLSHLRIVHSNDSRFVVTCGLNGCATTSRSFPSLYSHIYRNHPGIIRKRKAVSQPSPTYRIGSGNSGNLTFDSETSGKSINFVLQIL